MQTFSRNFKSAEPCQNMQVIDFAQKINFIGNFGFLKMFDF